MKGKILLLFLAVVLLTASLTSCRQQLSQREIERFVAGATDFYNDYEEFFDLMLLAWNRFTKLRATEGGRTEVAVRAVADITITNGEVQVGVSRGTNAIQSKFDLFSLEEWETVEAIIMEYAENGGIDVYISDEMIHISSPAGTFGSPVLALEWWAAGIARGSPPHIEVLNKNWGIAL